jgi:tRNA pseudouridine13 synthase
MKPEQRSIYLSAARSYLFNLILSERVKLQNWNQAISGDVCMINQSNSYFKTELIDQILQNRIAIGEIHPTACLYGKGENMAMRDALAIEQKIIDAHPELIAGLLKFALEMDRRALRGYPENLHWQYVDSNQLQVSFFLAAGSYATALLRELIHFS